MKQKSSTRFLFLVGLVAVMLAFQATAAMAATPADAAVTAQTGPYEAPELLEVDLPGWAEPFEPLAQLPLWAQAAIVSAAIAGLVFVTPIASRWMWSLGEDAERTQRERNE